MKRFALLISATAVLVGLLAAAPSAFGIKAGFNVATKRLEASYKIALFERRVSEDGCYPPPPKLAQAIPQAPHPRGGGAPQTQRAGDRQHGYLLPAGPTF